jgi:hypothetical protein
LALPSPAPFNIVVINERCSLRINQRVIVIIIAAPRTWSPRPM